MAVQMIIKIHKMFGKNRTRPKQAMGYVESLHGLSFVILLNFCTKNGVKSLANPIPGELLLGVVNWKNIKQLKFFATIEIITTGTYTNTKPNFFMHIY